MFERQSFLIFFIGIFIQNSISYITLRTILQYYKKFLLIQRLFINKEIIVRLSIQSEPMELFSDHDLLVVVKVFLKDFDEIGELDVPLEKRNLRKFGLNLIFQSF